MPHTETAGSSVPFPPPLAYFAGMALGFALHFVRPARIVTSAPAESSLALFGWGLLALSATLVISGLFAFRQAHTSHTFNQASTSLIVRGPFSLSRNPAYLAGALVHWGVSFLANALWVLLLLIPAVAVVNALIKREEGYLSRRFGAEYQTYRNRVRRWF
jgi:protein-S-isoprenylcysteine O-methyltransferase Ste14